MAKTVYIKSVAQAKRVGIANPIQALVGTVVIPSATPKVVACAGSSEFLSLRPFRPRGKYAIAKLHRYLDGRRDYYYATSRETLNTLFRGLFGRVRSATRA